MYICERQQTSVEEWLGNKYVGFEKTKRALYLLQVITADEACCART